MNSNSVPLWSKGDWNGYFGLFTNNLTNIMVLAGLLTSGLKMPAWIVYGRILPAVGLSVLLASMYYTWMAFRLARKERRVDVTALPSGISVPHMFIIVFLIMGPIYWKTGNPETAWQAGLAWCLIEAMVAFLGAFIAPWIRKYTPRAAMLGTLAGVSLTFISMRPAMLSWEVPYISFVTLAIILSGWLARKRMPWNLPVGLVAILVGTVLGWATGYMKPEAVTVAVANINPVLPAFSISQVLQGFELIGPFLASAIPLGVYNFFESMDNLESASAAGDHYNTREAMVADACSSMAGCLAGSPFPIAIYIGHAGWKSVGARNGYSVASGMSVFFICLLGVVSLFLAIIPLVAILPILLYIGIIIGSQAFQASPGRHAPAVIAGMIPWLANWGQSIVDSALSAAGTSAQALGYEKLLEAGLVYRGMEILGSGAIIVGMLLAALTAFIIDRRFIEAAGFALGGAVLAFFGFIHASQIGIGMANGPAIGYVAIAAVCFIMSWQRTEGGDDSLGSS